MNARCCGLPASLVHHHSACRVCGKIGRASGEAPDPRLAAYRCPGCEARLCRRCDAPRAALRIVGGTEYCAAHHPTPQVVTGPDDDDIGYGHIL